MQVHRRGDRKPALALHLTIRCRRIVFCDQSTTEDRAYGCLQEKQNVRTENTAMRLFSPLPSLDSVAWKVIAITLLGYLVLALPFRFYREVP